MTDSDLYFLPLGGAGEFGTNLNLYGYNGKWLMVDCGMGFADGVRPGVDIILPDPRFIVERKADLVGMVITHAHEDHIGAIAHLWPRLKCPIYASPFAAALIATRFVEHGMNDVSHINIVAPGSTIDLAPFGVEFVNMTHSTLEPALLAIRTPAGMVVHTGDWKLDPNPVVGQLTDEARLKALGDEGVLAVVGDSTNAVVAGHSRSEGELETSLADLFREFPERIVVTCFSSNVARMVSIQRAAAAAERQTALIGRSLWRIEEAARNCGYLDGLPPFLTEHDVGLIPRRNLVLICTGSQGEPRSALSRIAENDHPHVKLDKGDTIVFSARPIPGNEKAIIALQSSFSKRGIEVVTPDDAFVHVSGHPAQEELITLYQWLRPVALIPTHGEYPHMAEHARIAREGQIKNVLIPANGDLIRLTSGALEVVDHIEAGQLAIDGNRLIDLQAASLRTRQKLSYDGAALCSIVLDRKGRLMADPAVSAPGLLAEPENTKALKTLTAEVRQVLDNLPLNALRNDGDVREAARLAIRRHCNSAYGKKPWIDIHLHRVE